MKPRTKGSRLTLRSSSAMCGAHGQTWQMEVHGGQMMKWKSMDVAGREIEREESFHFS